MAYSARLQRWCRDAGHSLRPWSSCSIRAEATTAVHCLCGFRVLTSPVRRWCCATLVGVPVTPTLGIQGWNTFLILSASISAGSCLVYLVFIGSGLCRLHSYSCCRVLCTCCTPSVSSAFIQLLTCVVYLCCTPSVGCSVKVRG